MPPKTPNLRKLSQITDISKMFIVPTTTAANRTATGELTSSRVRQTYKSTRRQRAHSTRTTSENNGGVKY